MHPVCAHLSNIPILCVRKNTLTNCRANDLGCLFRDPRVTNIQPDFRTLNVRCNSFSQPQLRPPLNKKSFPVDRPGGIILRLYPAAFFFFFFFEKLKYFSYFSSDFQTVFTIVYRMIRRLHEKKNISEKKSISRPAGWFYFTSPGPQETLFYLRVASE